MKRPPIRPVSVKRRRDRQKAQPVIDAVFARDRGCVLRDHQHLAGPCSHELTPHHLRKQGQGGGWTQDNLVAICARHNVWVEDNPLRAHDLGLVVRRGETTIGAWHRMREVGLAVGPLVLPCDGAMTPPESMRLANGNRCACHVCGHQVVLVHDPSGWGGAVFADHNRLVVT